MVVYILGEICFQPSGLRDTCDKPLFQDDLWRRNYDTISALQLHASDFNPYYPTSVAYTPLPRPVLETFLIERGLLSRVPKSGDFFHTGFLNKLYIRLNEAVYGGSDQVCLTLGATLYVRLTVNTYNRRYYSILVTTSRN
jgi:hypothetical protein